MAGFASSFEKAFIPAANSSSAATLEAIKEKIKLNAEATKTAGAIDIMEATVYESIQKNDKLSQEELKSAMMGAEKTFKKMRTSGLDVTEATSLGKAVFPQAFVDPTLEAQRESTTSLNNATSFLMQDAMKRSGIIPTNPTNQSPSSESPVSEEAQQSAPLVTKLPLGRGGEMIMPDAMAKSEELRSYASTKGSGEAAISNKQKELSIKLGSLGKKLNTLRKQYDSALPDSGINSETSQRILGPIDVIQAKLGTKPNPKLLALQKNKRLQGIQVIKMAGEAGNLAEQEQKGAIEAIESANMTMDERKESIKQFMEVALSGSTTEAQEYLFKDKAFKSLLDEIGFDYEMAGIEKPIGTDFNTMSDEELRKLAGV